MASSNVDINIRANVDSALRNIGRLGALVKGFVIGAGFKALVNNITEAEDAAAQLDAAFRATGKTLGLTRTELDGLATELQNTTKFSDDLVKQAESVLLTFNKVRGEGFEKTIKAAADLSTRFGTDLVSSTKLLGKALQDPERGLTQLSRAGVTFSESQKNVIKGFIEGGERTKAQALILAEVEKRFGGAAAAARGTLSGALEGLKNSFGDLFESTKDGTSEAVKSINELSKALNDPEIKGAIDQLIKLIALSFSSLIKGLKDLIGPFKELTAALKDLVGVQVVSFFTKLFETLEKRSPVKAAIEGLTVLVKQTDKALEATEKFRLEQSIALTERKLKLTDPEDVRQIEFLTKKLAGLQSVRDRLAGNSGASTRRKAPKEKNESAEGVFTANEEIEESESLLTEVIINEQKRRVDANQQALDEIRDSTKTSAQKQIEEYNKIKVAIREQVSEGILSREAADEQLSEALDNLLPEIDIAQIKSMYKQVETQAAETSAIVRGAFEQAGASIQNSLSEAIQSGKLSLRSLVDVARKAFADIASALIVSGIKKLFLGAIGGGGGFAATAGSSGLSEGFLASTFAPKASGGLVPQGNSAIVGEEGRELVTALPGGGLRVMNKRQMSTTGGATVIYSPTNNISIIERENSQQTKQEIFQFVQIQNAKDREELYRKLAKNGVTIR